MHVFLCFQAWVPLAPRYWYTATCYYPPGSRAVQLLVFGGNLPAYTARRGDMVKCPTTGLRKWRGDFRILQWGELEECGYVDGYAWGGGGGGVGGYQLSYTWICRAKLGL